MRLEDIFSVGTEFTLNWDAAKLTGNEFNSGKLVRVEAVGQDWAVLRTEEFKPVAVTFTSIDEAKQFRYREG